MSPKGIPMRKVNWKTAVETRFHHTGVKVAVYGGITVLDDKAQAVIAALRGKCPDIRVAPKSTWDHAFDCDRRTDYVTFVVTGNVATINHVIREFKGVA